VKNRRVSLLKALRRLLADGKVIRTGAGKKHALIATRYPKTRMTSNKARMLIPGLLTVLNTVQKRGNQYFDAALTAS
jgi:hypothetical protein